VPGGRGGRRRGGGCRGSGLPGLIRDPLEQLPSHRFRIQIESLRYRLAGDALGSIKRHGQDSHAAHEGWVQSVILDEWT